MIAINSVTLAGELGEEPELRFTQQNKPVLNLRLITTEDYTGRDGEQRDRTDWHSVVVWGKRAEDLAAVLHKGAALYVEGQLRHSSYEGRDGQKRSRTEISARKVVPLGATSAAESKPTTENHQADSGGFDDDDIPF